MFKPIFTIFVSLSFFSSFSQTDSLIVDVDEVIVTALKYETQSKQAAQPVYVIDQEMIQANPSARVSELLQQIPGIHIQETSGNIGSPLQYTLRGAQSKDILILVDGMPVSDDSFIENFQDLNQISVQNLERIEVVTGGSTTLYGSNAAAGVINFISKSNQKDALHLQVSQGKYNTQNYVVNGTKTLSNKVSVNGFADIRNTDGFSSATNLDNTTVFDDDASDQFRYGAGIKYQATERFTSSLSLRGSSHDYSFDGGAFIDGGDNFDNEQQVVSWQNKLETDFGNFQLNASYINNDRQQFSPFGRPEDELFSQFIAQQWQGDLFYNSRVLSQSIITAGLYAKTTNSDQFGVDFFTGEFVQNISTDSANFELFDPYLSVQFNELDFISLDAGARYHNHSDYDSEFVYHVKPVIEFFENKSDFSAQLKGGYYTSFNTPSLFQLYSSFGNQLLTQESSETIEGTISLQYKGFISASVTNYRREDENQVGFSNTTFAFANIDQQTEANGWEAQVQINQDIWNASLFYASTERDVVADFFKFPTNEFGTSFQVQIPAGFRFSGNVRRVGERILPFFNPATFEVDEIPADAYTNVFASINKSILDQKINLFLTGKNLLDADLNDNIGFNWEERNVTLGANFRLQ